jgi:hypothetical protein
MQVFVHDTPDFEKFVDGNNKTNSMQVVHATLSDFSEVLLTVQ